MERIRMRGFFFVCLLLCFVLQQVESATLVYHQPTAVVYHHPATLEEQQHPGYTIVAPLTKIAHVTYDSVPISHTPFEHVPLFQRIGHVKGIRL